MECFLNISVIYFLERISFFLGENILIPTCSLLVTFIEFQLKVILVEMFSKEYLGPSFVSNGCCQFRQNCQN